MSTGIVAAAAGSAPSPMRFDGVALAQVVDNRDMTGQARVQLRLPWLPGIEPWARVAVPMAGDSRGTFIIPQVGDEVLVAFIELDDMAGSVTVTTPSKQRITLSADGIELSAGDGAATISLSASGAITVEGRTSIELKAPTVTVSASASAEVSGDASVKVSSSGECSVSGGIVRIN
ncbi:MAG: phage baseplate assembly protein V [Thermoleophilia bacterium]|nr:phage baseplate assembly protein V [Thermoleophilia bacterium]